MFEHSKRIFYHGLHAVFLEDHDALHLPGGRGDRVQYFLQQKRGECAIIQPGVCAPKISHGALFRRACARFVDLVRMLASSFGRSPEKLLGERERPSFEDPAEISIKPHLSNSECSIIPEESNRSATRSLLSLSQDFLKVNKYISDL